MPDNKTGGGKIFLSVQAMAVLSQLPCRSRGPILGIKTPKHVWLKVRALTGVVNLRMYDQRHTFASVALSGGATLDEVGILLNHSDANTTKRYAHLIDDAAYSHVARISELLLQRQTAVDA